MIRILLKNVFILYKEQSTEIKIPVSISSFDNKKDMSESLCPSHLAKHEFAYWMSPAQTGLYSFVHIHISSFFYNSKRILLKSRGI